MTTKLEILQNILNAEIKDNLNNRVFKTVSAIAEQRNTRVYLIGGYVRDFILQRLSKDIDIVVEGSGIELAEKVAEVFKTHVNVFKNFGTAGLNVDGMEIEFVGARKESYQRESRKPIVENGTLEDDQKRRDFTINALAFSLNKSDFGKIEDPFDGISDLEKKIIRTPLDPNVTFSDDPLRMMRAIRFAAQLGFTVHNDALDAIKNNSDRMEIISKERIAEEINKIILSPKPSTGFYLLEQTGLLRHVFPQLQKLKGIEAYKSRRHKDNFEHTLKVLDNTALTSNDLWLRWSALLHDIAKPDTKKYDDRAGWTFHGHEFIGGKMIPGIFKQLKLPLNEKMKYVQKMVSLHMRPIVLSQEEVTDSAVRRLLFDAGDDVDDLMTLCEADITSKNEKTVARHLENFKTVRQKLIEIEEKDAIRNFQPPITGQEIMETYGLDPCKEVGIIKNTIKEAILDGIIGNDHDEALELMKIEAGKLGLIPKA